MQHTVRLSFSAPVEHGYNLFGREEEFEKRILAIAELYPSGDIVDFSLQTCGHHFFQILLKGGKQEVVTDEELPEGEEKPKTLRELIDEYVARRYPKFDQAESDNEVMS